MMPLLFLIELCNNLDNKIIRYQNTKFHRDKDNSFYYRDNSKFLDTTVYYAKNKTLICRTITKQDKHIILLPQSDNYIAIKILSRDIIILITDHQSSNSM